MSSLRLVALLSSSLVLGCNPYDPSFQDLKCGPDASCPDGLSCVEGVCRGDLLERCGDGYTVGQEACDDGNTDDGDGCNATCTQASCYVPITHASLAEGLADPACATVYVRSGTYPGRFELGRDVTVLGVGATPPILDGEKLGSVVSVAANVSATLRNLTIKNGKAAAGGGIVNRGKLDLEQVLVTENTAEDASPNGGGIENLAGALTLKRTTVSQNRLVTTATAGAAAVLTGIGIHSTGGTITVTEESVIEENDVAISSVSGAAGRGGGIGAINTAVTVTKKSAVRGNDFVIDGRPGNGSVIGGGIYTSGGTLTLDGEININNNVAAAEGVTSNGNIGAIASGGGVFCSNTVLTLNAVRFDENKASARGEAGTGAFGGAVAVRGGSVTAMGAEFHDNVALVLGLGANSAQGTAGGGAIDLESANASFTRIIAYTNTVSAGTESAASGASAQGGAFRVSSVGATPRTFALISSTVEGNSATSSDSSAFGGGLYAFFTGGSTAEQLTLNVTATTFSTNKVQSPTSAQGGGIRANVPDGTGAIILNVVSSTLSSNKADGLTGAAGGGALSAVTSGGSARVNVNLASSTIASNTAVATSLSGGGIVLSSAASPAVIAATMKNTIVADNVGIAATPDCVSNATITSNSYNLLGVAAGCTFSATTGHLTGAAGLGPLADNGGKVKTHSLNAGSQAINAANPAGCTDLASVALPFDQRGLNRAVGRCDIGAYEVQ